MSFKRAATLAALIAASSLTACSQQAARPGTENAGATAESGQPAANTSSQTGNAEGPAAAITDTAKSTEAAVPAPKTVEEAFSVESSPLVPAKLIAEAVDKGMDIQFVDARVQMDYDLSHIPGAIDVPYFEAEKHLAELPKDRWIVTYCECPTAEAKQVADTLKNNGFTKVKIIEEGLQGWKELGRTVEGTSPSKQITAAPAAPAAPTP